MTSSLDSHSHSIEIETREQQTRYLLVKQWNDMFDDDNDALESGQCCGNPLTALIFENQDMYPASTSFYQCTKCFKEYYQCCECERFFWEAQWTGDQCKNHTQHEDGRFLCCQECL